MDIGSASLSTGSAVLLFLALAMALAFEFVNGFHDTANAVATVIYTHSLPAGRAVVWSGLWNLIGVLTSSGAVAFGVTSLLPVELVLNVGSAAGFAMVFALLASAMIWNLGTWYYGLPASSSHTLIGAILGVGLANSMLNSGNFVGGGVNWAKAGEVGLSLLISPVVGFFLAAGLLLLAKAVVRDPNLYRPADRYEPPPPWIRGLLILTCTGVSFAHGSNDGQKGMGLIMLILVGILPGSYALNLSTSGDELPLAVQSLTVGSGIARRHAGTATLPSEDPQAAWKELSAFVRSKSPARGEVWSALAVGMQQIGSRLNGIGSLSAIDTDGRKALRTEVYLVTSTLQELQKQNGALADATDRIRMKEAGERLDRLTHFIPAWVKVAVAVALGLGTMIGWKRIVVTVGEKIGKVHLSYAQGASAEVVAMTTIGAADIFGLPVSTTHVLSSGVAGAMAANHSGLQRSTVRNLLLAWVLTLPVCVFLGAMLFALGLNLLAGLRLS